MDELDIAAGIHKAIQTLYRNSVRYNETYHKKVRKLQNSCPHPRTVFEVDPCGGNDSCNRCLDCDRRL